MPMSESDKAQIYQVRSHWQYLFYLYCMYFVKGISKCFADTYVF